MYREFRQVSTGIPSCLAIARTKAGLPKNWRQLLTSPPQRIFFLRS